ncbi:hypothetical protein PUW24_00530 (plasmid) [Paenibacillus urinalis]|uniref:Uncharacterized protein n=1 Tax=Paenibacillus urinalis TaxID=521520 RepID=A0AAX3N650_9BACL|nr:MULTISPECIES: hypothetical protein [Paenibacillus]WDH85315.1 hypothetical protein PUW23_26120 [Paenibacillus urinalis]WDH95077.1 hypothetical protein PUW24_00530 [Paenibacillus urinalis]WDI05278.1 hypothetical protein PUW25_27035 [Paenibacillus urinalis]
MQTIFKENHKQRMNPELINQMESVVKSVIVNEKFHADFYLHDLKVMDSSNGGIFAWYVYDCGTHLIQLSNYDEVIAFQKEWIQSMPSIRDKHWRDCLYVCDTAKSELKIVKSFSEGNLVEQLKLVV